MMEEKVLINVEGMDCANCALTITRTLEKSGLKDVNVNFATGEVTFLQNEQKEMAGAVKSIEQLGYKVVETVHETQVAGTHVHENRSNLEKRFIISAIFTVPLLLHMFLPYRIFHEPVFQLLFSIPVIIIGILQFGRGTYYSLRAGVPNMDVLIFTGSMAAFIYSIAGAFFIRGVSVHNYLFFETGATIITLVLLGNLIEQRSVKQTTSAISELKKLQPLKAKKIVNENGTRHIVECNITELKVRDIILLNTGDRIPADGKLYEGTIVVDESMLTGESIPLNKGVNDSLTGGTLVESGNASMIIERTGDDSVLGKIIELVKTAQNDRPAIQKLGDRISAIFVPVVLGIALLTFFISWLFFSMNVSTALMHSIAVLVISCPCAMGLATPTAVMVGIGRAAKNGILIKGGSTLEQLAKVKTIIFDKTGTLTTGNFKIRSLNIIDGNETFIRGLIHDLELHSSHPIARSLKQELYPYSDNSIVLTKITEDKGIGINATDSNGDLYSIGSFQMVKHLQTDLSHDIYLLKNNKLIATIDLQDEIRNGAKEAIDHLRKDGYRLVLLSGDRKSKCESVAEHLGITEVYSEKLPKEKLAVLEKLMKENPVAMIGDGINDAPSLAKASVGISISNATDVAVQSAQIVLLDRQDFNILIKAITISKKTYLTIKQNLFWAFFYNVIAIPVAAAGYLSPMIGALSMAFSDVIVIGNSLRLRSRKI
jgi:P-type Cu+ transporter